MLGGPLGALLGASLGHNFDKGMGRLDGMGGIGNADQETIQSAFFTSTFFMMGHISKVDGHVSHDEIHVTQHVMRQMNLNVQQKKVAINLFEQGKSRNIEVKEVLEQFRKECHRRRNLMQMFIEILVMTALADGALHKSEEKALWETAQTLGFTRTDFQHILQRGHAQQHYQQNRRSQSNRSSDKPRLNLKDAYKLLSISSSANDQEVKKAYRKQMNQHHPDKLVSKGLPQEMMDIANQKTQDIKAAYELIKQTRS
jgi:DnaJ like chaperone protein